MAEPEVNEKTIKMYLASNNVKVYPSAYRSASYDPEARLQTEYNLTHAVGQHGGQNSFVVDFGAAPDGTSQEDWANPLKCVVGGYYFELSRSAKSAFSFPEDAEDAAIDNIYLGVSLRPATISVSSVNLYSSENNQGNDHVVATTSQHGTEVLQNLAKQSVEGEDASDDILDQMLGPNGDGQIDDDVSYFYGLAVIKCASAAKGKALSDYSAFVKIFTRGEKNEEGEYQLVEAYDSKITNAISAGEAASSVILNVDKDGRETDRENEINVASGEYSTAMGVGTIARNEGQLAFGKYNQEPTKDLVETVGGGFETVDGEGDGEDTPKTLVRKTVRQLNSVGLEKLTSGLVVQDDVTEDDNRQISIKLLNDDSSKGSKTNKTTLTERTLIISNDDPSGETDAYKTRVSASVGGEDMTTSDNTSTWASLGVYGGATAVEINAPANGLGNASIALSDKANAGEGITGLTKKANIGLTEDTLEIAAFYDWDKDSSKYLYTESNEGKIKLRAGESIELTADSTATTINRHVSLIADGEKAKFDLRSEAGVDSATLQVDPTKLSLTETSMGLIAPKYIDISTKDNEGKTEYSELKVGGETEPQQITLDSKNASGGTNLTVAPSGITAKTPDAFSLSAGKTIDIALTDSLLLNMNGGGENAAASASLKLNDIEILSVSVPSGTVSGSNQITVKIGATGINTGNATNALSAVNVILPTLTDQEIDDIFNNTSGQ